MAILNMNQLFDELKKYIDKKMESLEDGLKDLFEEYGLKEILPYLNDIQMVAVNIDAVKITGQNIEDVKTVSKNIDEILKAPEYIQQIQDGVDQAEDILTDTKQAGEYAFQWAQNPYNEEIDDGIRNGYSSYHWSKVSENNTYNITFIGGWDPHDNAYPTPTNHGDYWIVTTLAQFDNDIWMPGDLLVWEDTAENTGWVHKRESTHWLQIVGKPSMYTPKPHYHSEYVQEDNLLIMSDGPGAAGYPIKLWLNGQIHNSMIKLPVTYIVGSFSPSPDDEYPNVEEYDTGASWLISGIDLNNGYTFTGGQLVGRKIRNGDFMIWSHEGWLIQYDKLNVQMYLRRDGEYPMFGDLFMGRNRIRNLDDGVLPTDAVTVRQLGAVSDEVFTKADHIAVSEGQVDQGKPIVLNEWGLIDPTMVNFKVLTPMGGWDPDEGQEYPSVDDQIPGNYWEIYGVPDEGYTFQAGDLVGKTIKNGDWLLYTQNGWYKVAIELKPELYYRVDGTNPITAPFNAGGHTISHIGDAVVDTDAVSFRQVQNIVDDKAPLIHQHSPIDITPQGSGSNLDADTVDGYEASDFAMLDHNHSPGDIQPQGADSGLDADKLDGYDASDFRKHGESILWADVEHPDEFPPVKATQEVIGGVRAWVEGDVLYIETTDYVAP